MSFFEDKIYTYTLEHDYYYNNPMHPKISKMLVCSDKKDQIWLTIQPGGIIGIPQGYAWDGCSPKITFFSTTLCGIWDSPLLKDGYPTCYLQAWYTMLCASSRRYTCISPTPSNRSTPYSCVCCGTRSGPTLSATTRLSDSGIALEVGATVVPRVIAMPDWDTGPDRKRQSATAQRRRTSGN